MKKGFSLVELSIVLVIIGVLMGMVVKGKSLIESARVRSDIAKVKNIQLAWFTYQAVNLEPLGRKSDSSFDFEKLNLKREDFYLKYLGYTFTLYGMQHSGGGMLGGWGNVAVISTNEFVPYRRYCMFERTADDAIPVEGNVRPHGGGWGWATGGKAITANDLKDCNSKPASGATGVRFVIVLHDPADSSRFEF